MASSELNAFYVVAGLILCLFGWVLYWVGLRLLGAAFGATAGVALSWFLFQQFQIDARWELAAIALAGVVGAFAGFFLMTHAHYLVFFVTGAMLGLAAAITVETTWPEWFGLYFDTPLLQLVFYSGAALVIGVLVLALNRVIIMAVTAFAGTVLVASSLPREIAVWLFLPLLLGSFLLQLGVLAAIGRPGSPDQAPHEEPAP